MPQQYEPPPVHAVQPVAPPPELTERPIVAPYVFTRHGVGAVEVAGQNEPSGHIKPTAVMVVVVADCAWSTVYVPAPPGAPVSWAVIFVAPDVSVVPVMAMPLPSAPPAVTAVTVSVVPLTEPVAEAVPVPPKRAGSGQ